MANEMSELDNKKNPFISTNVAFQKKVTLINPICNICCVTDKTKPAAALERKG